jgi:hypothetical protein
VPVWAARQSAVPVVQSVPPAPEVPIVLVLEAAAARSRPEEALLELQALAAERDAMGPTPEPLVQALSEPAVVGSGALQVAPVGLREPAPPAVSPRAELAAVVPVRVHGAPALSPKSAFARRPRDAGARPSRVLASTHSRA